MSKARRTQLCNAFRLFPELFKTLLSKSRRSCAFARTAGGHRGAEVQGTCVPKIADWLAASSSGPGLLAVGAVRADRGGD